MKCKSFKFDILIQMDWNPIQMQQEVGDDILNAFYYHFGSLLSSLKLSLSIALSRKFCPETLFNFFDKVTIYNSIYSNQGNKASISFKNTIASRTLKPGITSFRTTTNFSVT